MLGPCWGHVGAMLRPMGLCGPILVHVWVVWGHVEGHVEPMLGQERRAPFGSGTRPKGARLFGVVLGPCWGLRVSMSGSLGPC